MPTSSGQPMRQAPAMGEGGRSAGLPAAADVGAWAPGPGPAAQAARVTRAARRTSFPRLDALPPQQPVQVDAVHTRRLRGLRHLALEAGEQIDEVLPLPRVLGQ